MANGLKGRHVHYVQMPGGLTTRTDARTDSPGHTHTVFGVETGPPIRDGLDHRHEINMPEEFDTTVGLVTGGKIEVGSQVSGLAIGESRSRKGVLAGLGLLAAAAVGVALTERRAAPPRLTGLDGNRNTHSRLQREAIQRLGQQLEQLDRALRAGNCGSALRSGRSAHAALSRALENARFAEQSGDLDELREALQDAWGSFELRCMK